ncbi:MAG TPA: serine hydrolase, partial [Clostridiales bacterium]|nr:serine hydrolase [Clostridiales bacterium]
MKKKAAIIFTAVFLIVTVIMHDGDLAVITSSFNASSISAKAAVLMCADTGEVLFSLNKDLRLPMASTTKIMTALIALEDPSPMREIKVTKEMVAVEGTSMGLLPDDTISLYTLAAGMLLESGNDAANVTAYAIAGGLNEFAKLMNKKAKELGLKNTNFVTPSGLDADKHYSTAYDLALLGAAAIKNPLFKEICSQKSMKVEFGNPPYPRWLYNHNRLLSSYEGTIGIKTGYTKKSGRCL